MNKHEIYHLKYVADNSVEVWNRTRNPEYLKKALKFYQRMDEEIKNFSRNSPMPEHMHELDEYSNVQQARIISRLKSVPEQQGTLDSRLH